MTLPDQSVDVAKFDAVGLDATGRRRRTPENPLVELRAVGILRGISDSADDRIDTRLLRFWTWTDGSFHAEDRSETPPPGGTRSPHVDHAVGAAL